LLYSIPNLLRSSLALLSFLGLTSLALENGLTVLVELQLGDDDLGGVDADWDGLKVGLLVGDTLNVDNVFETVDRGDLALLALVVPTDNGNLIILADWYASNLYVYSSQFYNVLGR